MSSREKEYDEFEKLPPEEKKEFSSFEDYLGANARCICEGCDNVVDYDEVNEDGYCFDCGEPEEEIEDDEED